jgi:hypothetical protein
MLSRLGSLALWKRPQAKPCASQDEPSFRSTAPCENDEDESSSGPAPAYEITKNKVSKLLSIPNEILQEVMWQCGSSDLVSLGLIHCTHPHEHKTLTISSLYLKCYAKELSPGSLSLCRYKLSQRHWAFPSLLSRQRHGIGQQSEPTKTIAPYWCSPLK